MFTEVLLDDLTLDPAMQCRVGIDQLVVTEYAEAIAGGAELPPIEVVKVDDALLVVDGWHRVWAHRQAKRSSVEVKLTEGTRRDAMLAAVRANASHGLQRTMEDKRRAVRLLLGDPEWSKLSGRDLGKLAQVSHTFVDQTRATYGLRKGEALTEETISRVDGTPTGRWKELIDGAADYAKPTIDAVRKVAGPFDLAGMNTYSNAGQKAVELRKEELRTEAWPWPEDDDEAQVTYRVKTLDTVKDIALALRSKDCPDPELLYKVLEDLKSLPTCSYNLDAMAARNQDRPAIARAIQARKAKLAEKDATRKREPWELAREIQALDETDQAAAVRSADQAVFEELRPNSLHRVVVDGEWRSRLDLDADPDPCVVVGCAGWVWRDKHGYVRCAHCNEIQAQWLHDRRVALGKVSALLDGGYGVPVDVGDDGPGWLIGRRDAALCAQLFELGDKAKSTDIVKAVRAWLESTSTPLRTIPEEKQDEGEGDEEDGADA